MKILTGPEKLKKEVMDRNLCTGCGACVGLCPYIYAVNERVALVHSCGLKEGNCHQVCPRIELNPVEMDKQVFNKPRADHILGENKGIFFARAVDQQISENGQYGGVVTALAAYMVKNKKVDAAVLTRANGNDVPEPVLVQTMEEVLGCSGSKYSACPTLKIVSEGLKKGFLRLCVVGRPCQVIAFRKMQRLCGQNKLKCFPDNKFEAIVIGLFCFWSLSPDFYIKLKDKTAGNKTVRLDIPPNRGLVAVLENGAKVEFPLEELRPLIREACVDCFDITSEYADVSVGSTEYDPEWNTLIVRTEKGEALIKEAQAAGVIEIKQYPSEILPNLLTAVANKKARVLHGLQQGDYLRLSDDYLQGFYAAQKTTESEKC
ncbi:Coenzyme F420 hydrogenase/dehydrogenase, beta subunit C-terminal domain [Desulfallas sp. Bu1-1]|uniref:Coenzyme F420 hydrogenase/dehydrogenase, beta subunit C-terminal domain n=1 Tax=Desulfallas sp. Bu1-1 TaxID=2787620 RepID=UPI00189EC156|nr:Coenzyme F420 hydrogenase/dehydrogenase, beta subunit C-terminal domain [Desulfallas sp. Bu1-1]MBF7083659.1 Coenzyme F420 hydrogenase/dehydrogenase, beta subunit C-terminal domain [Desulfallas sp. Bu1-1]